MHFSQICGNFFSQNLKMFDFTSQEIHNSIPKDCFELVILIDLYIAVLLNILRLFCSKLAKILKRLTFLKKVFAQIVFPDLWNAILTIYFFICSVVVCNAKIFFFRGQISNFTIKLTLFQYLHIFPVICSLILYFPRKLYSEEVFSGKVKCCSDNTATNVLL